MLNQFVIVGRLQSMIGNIMQVKIVGNKDNDTKILDIKVSENIAQHCRDYDLKAGDLVGVKGKFDLDPDFFLIADKITFLSSAKHDDVTNEGGE